MPLRCIIFWKQFCCYYVNVCFELLVLHVHVFYILLFIIRLIVQYITPAKVIRVPLLSLVVHIYS